MFTRICVGSGSVPPMDANIVWNVGTTKISIATRTMNTSEPIAIG